MSGTVLEQAQLYQPEAIVVLQELFDVGTATNRPNEQMPPLT